MLTPRENAMAIYEGRQPDAYLDIMSAVRLLPDPISIANRFPQDGKEHQDDWGTTFVFLPGAPGKHPVITPENAVIKDIEKWREQLVVPTATGRDWSLARKAADETDRHEKLVGVTFTAGLFERTPHLMGFEQALMAYLEYPEEMEALLRVIADHKIAYIREMAREVHPDIIFYHDDWGSKQNVFLPPRVWRELIKPLQTEIANTIHACGMIYMHHADCICQPIVEDMVDVGIDIWQGVIAQNDIPEIQRITKGRLAMAGGVDAPLYDRAGVTEEAIRAHVRSVIDTCCPAGRFYPAIPNGRCFNAWNDSIMKDELVKYGREFAQKHPR